MILILFLLQTTLSSTTRSVVHCGQGASVPSGQSSLLTGMTSYFTLDESSDGSVSVSRADSRGLNTMSDPDKLPSTPGKLGNAVACDGLKWLIRSHSDDNKTGDRPFAMSGWFNLTDGPTHEQIFSKGNEWYVRLTDEGFADLATNHFDHASVLSNHYGGWHFFYTAYNQVLGRIEIRIDGAAAVTTPISSPVTIDPLSNLMICSAFSGGQNANGPIDEVGYWIGRVLTTAEQDCLYGGGTPPAYPFTGVCAN